MARVKECLSSVHLGKHKSSCQLQLPVFCVKSEGKNPTNVCVCLLVLPTHIQKIFTDCISMKRRHFSFSNNGHRVAHHIN